MKNTVIYVNDEICHGEEGARTLAIKSVVPCVPDVAQPAVRSEWCTLATYYSAA